MSIDSAFTQFPTLSTERLNLRQVREEDAEAFYAIKSDSEVTYHYGVEPHRSPADTLNWVRLLLENYQQRQALVWVLNLKKDDRVIGAVTFWNFQPGYHCVELGYELLPAYHGQGFMREAVAAVLDFGFHDLGLHRVEACPLAENEPSKALLTRLGFTLEGTLRQRVSFQGRDIDQLYYGLLENEWGM